MSEAGKRRSRQLLRAVAARNLGGLEAALSGPQAAPELAYQGVPALHVAALRDWAPGVTALLSAGACVSGGAAGCGGRAVRGELAAAVPPPLRVHLSDAPRLACWPHVALQELAWMQS